MKICAVLSEGFDRDELKLADLAEIDLDVFDALPYVDKERIIKIRDPSNITKIPADYDGLIDVGLLDVPLNNITIASYHDHSGTPDSGEIIKILGNMNGNIVKGAFRVNSIKDLMSIFDSSGIERPHILIGMGDLGIITRICQNVLRNEFTYAHTGIPSAPGQMSVSEMKAIGDDRILTGLIGHPLTNVSKIMHDAAFRAAGINGRYLLFDSSTIERAGDVIRSYGLRGVNVTIPFKSRILEQLDSLDAVAEEVGAVNTIVNDDGHLIGYNTDVIGVKGAFDAADVSVKGKRALIIGSGGSARACAYHLVRNGADTYITSRNFITAGEVSKEFGCTFIEKASVPLKMFDILINCTPLKNHEPIGLDHLDHSHIVFDLVHHTETALVRRAVSMGCTIVSGKDMLAIQGAESFKLWTGLRPWEAMRDSLEQR